MHLPTISCILNQLNEVKIQTGQKTKGRPEQSVAISGENFTKKKDEEKELKKMEIKKRKEERKKLKESKEEKKLTKRYKPKPANKTNAKENLKRKNTLYLVKSYT